MLIIILVDHRSCRFSHGNLYGIGSVNDHRCGPGIKSRLPFGRCSGPVDGDRKNGYFKIRCHLESAFFKRFFFRRRLRVPSGKTDTDVH